AACITAPSVDNQATRGGEMKLRKTLGVAALVAGLAVAAGAAQAKPRTVGMILSMSEPFADFGMQIKHGIELYMQAHGDEVAGRQVQLIVKDDTGIDPQLAKREAKQLIVKDKVDVLAGFDLTPNAFSVAPLAT